MRYNLFDWQSLSPGMGTEGWFFRFCDALEVNNGVTAPASGFGVDHALAAWGNFWKSSYLNACKPLCVARYDLHLRAFSVCGGPNVVSVSNPLDYHMVLTSLYQRLPWHVRPISPLLSRH